MAGKQRKRKPAAGGHEDLAKPTVWRRQHGGFTEAFRDADPDTGAVVSHRRAIDLLARLEANGTITGEMHDAGDMFMMQFRAAAMDTVRITPLLRIPSATGTTITERAAAARRKVAEAMDALGGVNSAAGSCVWHVVGCEASIREWALRQGWGGKSVGHAQAQGILMAALGVLVFHYGLDRHGAARSGHTPKDVAKISTI
jgi:hypothetical protein